MTIYLIWSVITIALYAIAFRLYTRTRRFLLQPLLAASAVLIVLVILVPGTYDNYKAGTAPLTFLVGPSTVALAVPLYRHAQTIHKHWKAALGSIFVGSLIGLALPPVIVFALGGSLDLALTMAPKSTTTPVAVEIARALGGVPELTAVFTVVTGLLGSLFGPPILKRFGWNDPVTMGLALGVSSHAVGTAKMAGESEVHGSFSGFAMAMTGIITALLSLPFYS